MTDWAVSALKWWQEAGVDTFVAETPRDWLAPAAPERVAESLPHPPTRFEGGPLHQPGSIGPSGGRSAGLIPQGDREVLPETLEAFQDWLMNGAVPLAAPSTSRVGPAGDPASGLMILVDMPSPEDVAAGRLLSGAPGELFDKMMAAIGWDRETLYLAPLSPVRTPTGMLPAAAVDELARIARHHVGLVKPKALLLFGDAASKALLGAPIAEARGKWHELDTMAGKISTLVTIRPEKLVSQPGLKKFAWEDLQRLREELG